jgi:hypothetical protein
LQNGTDETPEIPDGKFVVQCKKNVAMQHGMHYVVFADDDRVRRHTYRRNELAPMIASGLKEMRS